VAAVRSLARVLRILELASQDLNPAHYRVLSAIASGDERASRVARRLALGKPAVSAAVEALTRRGLVDRAPAAADGRVSLLRLTDEGRDVLERAEANMAGVLERLRAGRPHEDEVLASLGALGTAIDAAVERRDESRRGANA
jgi:DNA-binding MarR family transcriptional regulator